MSAIVLGELAGALLSLMFSFAPGLKDWYQDLTGVNKRLVMVGIIVLSAVLVFGASCAGLSDGVSCDQAGINDLLSMVFAAVMSSQATYLLTPKSK